MLGKNERFTVKIALYAPNNSRVALALKSAKIRKIIPETKDPAFWKAKINGFKGKIFENVLIEAKNHTG